VLKDIPPGHGERYPLKSINVGNRRESSSHETTTAAAGTARRWVKPESKEPAFQMGVNIYAYVVAH